MPTAKRTTTVPHDEVLADLLATNSAFRTECERAKLASAIALAVFTYRADRGLSQRALADMLGMRQPQVARMEAGEVNPTMDTLTRLSKALGLHVTIRITPDDPSPDLAPIDTAFTTVTVAQPPPHKAPRLVSAP